MFEIFKELWPSCNQFFVWGKEESKFQQAERRQKIFQQEEGNNRFFFCYGRANYMIRDRLYPAGYGPVQSRISDQIKKWLHASKCPVALLLPLNCSSQDCFHPGFAIHCCIYVDLFHILLFEEILHFSSVCSYLPVFPPSCQKNRRWFVLHF